MTYRRAALPHELTRCMVTTGSLKDTSVVYLWEFSNGCLRVAIFVDGQKVA